GVRIAEGRARDQKGVEEADYHVTRLLLSHQPCERYHGYSSWCCRYGSSFMIRRSWLALTFLLLVGPSVLGEAPVDLCVDPLPAGALTGLGSIRFLHPSRIRHLAFLPGDQQILGVCEQEVRLWDVRTGRQTMSFPGLNSIMCAALSPDGKTAAVAENGARIF